MLGDIMKKVDGQHKRCIGYIERCYRCYQRCKEIKYKTYLIKVGDFIDLFCDGALSCAIGASVFETGIGAKAKGNDATAKQIAQYAVKPPNSISIIGNGIPKNGFVPAVDRNGVKKIFNTATGALVDLNSAAGLATGLTEKAFDTRGPLEKFEGINFYDSAGNIAIISSQLC